MSNPLFHAYAFDDALASTLASPSPFMSSTWYLADELPQLRTNIIIWFVVLFETLCLAGGDSH